MINVVLKAQLINADGTMRSVVLILQVLHTEPKICFLSFCKEKLYHEYLISWGGGNLII